MIPAIENIQELKLDKSSWKLTKLGDLAEDISKRVDNPSTSIYDRFVGLEHFVSGDIKIKNWGSTENLASSAKAFQAGDILFARRNAYLRRASLVEFDGCCSGDAFVIRENHDKVIPGLLAFLMNSDALWDYANSNAAGTMSKRVKWRDLAEYEFLLPPKEEQAKLAELLWAMDEVIEREKVLAESLSKFMFKKKEFFFVKASGNLNHKTFSTFIIPENWDLKKMSDVADVEYGISESVANNTDFSLGWQILTGANINLDGSFNLEKKRYIEVPTNKRFLLEQGDLMFNWRSGSPEHIGKTAIFDLKGNYTFASFILKIRCGNQLRNRYAFYLLNFLREIEYFTKNIAKQVNFKINASVFREIEIPIPPLEEQLEMEFLLDSIHFQLLNVEAKIQSSRSLQKSLINQVF
jgi:type I restriction enzyme S subunit